MVVALTVGLRSVGRGALILVRTLRLPLWLGFGDRIALSFIVIPYRQLRGLCLAFKQD